MSRAPQTAEKTNGLWERDVCEIFIAPDADFNTLRPTFEQMLRTLRMK